MEPLPVCPKSGLLRSRCRCSDPDCYGKQTPTERAEGRGARRNRLRRERKKQQVLAGQQTWIQRTLEAHSRVHPEMYSEEFKRARDN